MLTLKVLRDDPEWVVSRLKVKNFDAAPIVEKVLELDAQRRSLQQESDALLSEQKKRAGEIGALMKQGLKAEAEAAKAAVAELKARSSELLAKGEEAAKQLQDNLVLLPNLPCDLVPEGKGAEDNGGICGVGMCEGIAAVRDAHGKAPVEEEIDNAGRARTAKAEVDELAGICAAVGFAMLREAVGALVRASVA